MIAKVHDNGRNGTRAIGGTFGAALGFSLMLALTSPSAYCANYALIMAIGNYSDPAASLPGIDVDARNAATIAEAMGVPPQNTTLLTDSELSVAGIRNAIADLSQKVGRGDGAFLYYSGHGTQVPLAPGKCSEALVAYDMQAYPDAELQQALAGLSGKAGQLVVMNDSCHSGGTAEKGLRGDRKAKFYKLPAAAGDYKCGQPVNVKQYKNLVATATEQGANMLYVAAARDNEAANATWSGNGSAATFTWLGCIQTATDQDHSGGLSGEELRGCAQRQLDNNHFDQHVALVGNAELLLSYVGSGTGPHPPAVNPTAVLQAIRDGASPKQQVALRVSKPKMKIGEDVLDFEVVTGQAGYLSVLQVGSDGRSFYLLFPNDHDRNSYVDKPTTLRLPRANWRVKAGGPAGTSYLMAVIAEKPRDFSKSLAGIPNTPFHSAPVDFDSSKNLYVEAVGGDSEEPGRYGASAVVPIEEF